MTLQHFWEELKTHKADISLTDATKMYNQCHNTVAEETLMLRGSFTHSGGTVSGQRVYPFNASLIGIEDVFVNGVAIGKARGGLYQIEDIT